jgi:transposase
MSGKGAWIEMTNEEMDALLGRAREKLSDEDYQKLEAIAKTFAYLTDRIKGGHLQEIRELMLRKKTEKTSKVLERAGAGDAAPIGSAESSSREPAPAGESADEDDRDPPLSGQESDPATAPRAKRKGKRRKGHGRNGADAYTGAEQVCVDHATLKPGERCPKCQKGKIYELPKPKVLVNVVGQAPLKAKLCKCQRLRCNLCGEVFTAAVPEEASESERYDATAAAMVGLLKYGTGVPFNRLERLQGSLGVPLPAGTQWGLIATAAGVLKPVFEALIDQAAQGELLHNDDTSVYVRELAKQIEQEIAERVRSGESLADQRTGMFTTGVVAVAGEQRIALFFTGRQHAGENLTDILRRRLPELDAPMQMCDGLDRNLPNDLEVILSNCVAHGRRKFIPLIENFPTASRRVLEALREVYAVEARCRRDQLDDDSRLALHQELSAPIMADLELWMTDQLDSKEIEPNSSLGRAMRYMLKRWERLTLFLRQPGAPIDNNVCERALKKAVLHRKNSLFYKTMNGAEAADIFMSLIHTCELGRVNPFDYLVELLRNPEAVARAPGVWLPWNYMLARASPAAA